MKIKVWNKVDKLKSIGNRMVEPTYTIEIPNKEIDHFIDRFGVQFGEAFGKAIVKGLEVEK